MPKILKRTGESSNKNGSGFIEKIFMDSTFIEWVNLLFARLKNDTFAKDEMNTTVTD